MKRLGVVRPKDLERSGVSRTRLYRLARQGLVDRQARGIYVARGHSYTAGHALAPVATRVPSAVICLLTALRFHGLTTQQPAEVWIALPEKARRPRIEYLCLRVARFSGTTLTEGIETHTIEGVAVDVAVEALKDFTQRHSGGSDDLARFARICRVARVMQPYLAPSHDPDMWHHRTEGGNDSNRRGRHQWRRQHSSARRRLPLTGTVPKRK